MGTKIEQVAVIYPKNRKQGRSSIRLSIEAAKLCLNKANCTLNEIELLINSGIYRDRHIGEPAIASLIHGQLERQLTPRRKIKSNENFFCHDLINGGSGPVNAFEVIDSFISSGQNKKALLVSGDALPSRWDYFHFPFDPAAMAILLTHTEEEVGFKAFHTDDYPEHAQLYTGQLSWKKFTRRKGYRNILEIDQDPDYLTACESAAQKSLNDFLTKNNLTPGEIDLVISSTQPTGLIKHLSSLFPEPERQCLTALSWNKVHTAGIGFGLQQAFREDRFAESKNILFMGIGAGITVSMAWYINQ